MLTHASRAAMRIARRNTINGSRFNQISLFSTDNDAKSAIQNEMELTPKVQNVLDQIIELNMIEIFELSNAIQKKFNLPDPSMAMGGGSGGATAIAEETKEEKTQFDVKLASFDAKQKIKVIKEIRAITGLGLKEAKELVENAPSVLKKDLKKEDAEALVAQLEAIGAVAELE